MQGSASWHRAWTCHGHIKPLVSPQANPDYTLQVEDLATIALDIITLDCGCLRLRQLGYALGLRVLEAPTGCATSNETTE
jgi:hypothetical protein